MEYQFLRWDLNVPCYLMHLEWGIPRSDPSSPSPVRPFFPRGCCKSDAGKEKRALGLLQLLEYLMDLNRMVLRFDRRENLSNDTFWIDEEGASPRNRNSPEFR